MALQDTDNLIVQRGSTLNKVQIQNMSTIQDTDLLVVGRGSESYKITGQDFKDSIGPSGTVDKPSIIAPADNAGETVSAESDEITGFSFISYSSLPTTGSSYGDAYPWSLAFRSIVDQDGAVGSTDATHYIQSFANIPATTVGLIVDNNLQWVGVAVNGVDLDISNAPISGSYAGNDLDAGFTTAVVREYTLPAGNTLDSIGVKTNGPRICGVIVDGTRLTDGQPALTLAGDKDLTVFQPLDDVQQDSGYTPQTSAITNVTATSVSLVRGYYSSDIPSNLTEAVSGTEFDMSKGGVNVVDNNHYLTLVCDPGCPDSGSVFKTDYGAIFDMKWSNGIGNFDANGNQLDAANNPPSGPSNTLDIVFSNGGTTGYIVNTQAAYTVIKTTANSTLPAVSDAAQGQESVLTLTDDTDLANFRVGDQVSGGAINVTQYVGGSTDVATASSKATAQYRIIGSELWSGYSDDSETVKLEDLFGDAAWNMVWWEHTSTTSGDAVAVSSRGPSEESTVGGWKSIIDPAKYYSFSYYGPGTPTSPDYVTYGPAGTDLPTPINFARTVPITAIGPGNTLTVAGGTWSNGATVTGPATTPATGTVASTDPAAGTMTLSVSDETFPKRWIVNAGKFVKGEETPSQDAAPDVDGLTIYSSNFASTPPGSLGHTNSDWQITLKTDTAYASPVAESFDDSTNLTTWEPGNLEGETEYRCRVKHHAGAIESEWSEDSTFKTGGDDDNSLVVKPGDLWVDGATAGLGSFRTTPVKMVSAAWGDRALALGVDGKIYKSPSLSYENMAEILSPPAGVTWTAIAQPYGSNCVAIRDDGLLDMFDSVSETITAQAVTFAGTGARFKAFSAVKNSSQMYFLGDDNRIYVANHLTTPTALTLLYQGHEVRNLAIGISDSDPDRSFFIDTNDDLYILRISGVGGPSASVNSVTQLNAGTKYKSVRIGYEGTAAAITKDGDLQIFLSNAVPTFDTALATNLPADFEIAEVGFGYLNIFARSKDGRVLVAGAAYGPNGPFKPGQETWSADTWAEYDLPRPCPGFGIIKECGVGYDFAFILP